MSKQLWRPSAERIARSTMARFMGFASGRAGRELADYDALYAWSIDHAPAFWEALWDFFEVSASRRFDQVVDDLGRLPGARWFEGARLNFAENLLRFRDQRVAITFVGEDRETRHLSYAQLFEQVARLAAALSAEGVATGDRVAGFLPNLPQTVIAMLATTSLGAVWSSTSPDFGIKGVLDRFGQIAPKVLFVADGYRYNGKAIDCVERVGAMLEQLPSVQRVVVVPYLDPSCDAGRLRGAVRWDGYLVDDPAPLVFTQVEAQHPLYVMYSSGTTGVPKCIVHGVAGTLVQHLKELGLHTDVTRDDTLFYFTTCGWMMWNWLVSALALGARVLLYDGAPFYPDPEALWRLAEQEHVSIFGTSARYLAALEKAGVRPGERFDLSALKAVLSTGSPLAEESFEFVYRDIKSDLCLSSISGGTDIVSCFALGDPTGPVFAGELQRRGLGMKVEAFDEGGRGVIGEKGELVCTQAAPSMPIGFWNDADGDKYRRAYFDVYPGVWRHGDYIEITERGGVIIYGRSDATLNPGGVRIGTAEIYRVVEGLDEIVDSLVVGQEWQDDVRVVLFVKLRAGGVLDAALRDRLRVAIRAGCSPRHVPQVILAVADIPYTISGKKVELAVRQVIHGQEVKNRDALANPEALELFRDLEALAAHGARTTADGLFWLRGGMRYTRWSCLPFGARLDLEEIVQAESREEALRQAALCLHRDLEELLSRINAINVSEVYLEIDELRPVATAPKRVPWNPQPFAPDVEVPPHVKIVARDE